MSPVHLIAVEPAEVFEITTGNDLVTLSEGSGSKLFSFSSKCGCQIYQCPGEEANFRAIMQTSFHIEDGVSGKLTEEYLPKARINNENGQRDWNDELPKFKYFSEEGLVNNEGNDV